MTKSTTPNAQTNLKIVAISDIHSNIFALEAVLKDIERHEVDYIVNLGDILYGAIAPRATYERLQALKTQYSDKVITIRGNQDRQIYEAINDPNNNELETNPTMRFIANELPHTAIEWLQNLPFDCQLTPSVYLCHATPSDDMIYLLEDVSEGFPKIRNDSDIISLLAGNTSPVVVCGHTHIPRTVTLSTGQTIINTGSVGYPAYQDDLPVVHKMQTYSPHASYCLIESINNNGTEQWQASHIKVPYDHEKSANLALKNGRTDWYHALMTGRVGD